MLLGAGYPRWNARRDLGVPADRFLKEQHEVGDRLAVRELAVAETPHQFVDVAAPFVDVPRDDGEPIDRLPGDSRVE